MRRVAAALLASMLAAQDGNWTTYSGNPQGHRYSPLQQINTSNIQRLKPVWMYQVRDLNQFEATPLVVDGIMYLTEPPSNATALETSTGRPLWLYRRNISNDVRPCCGHVNRGLAML